MWHDLLTACALLLIIEGLLPMISPRGWQRIMQDLSGNDPRIIRIGGIISMLAGAVMLQLLN